MSRDSDLTERLRRDIVRAIVDDTGMGEQMALPVANSVLAFLQSEYPGQRMYVPARPKQYDVLEIDAALRAGEVPKRVCERFGVSMRTLRRMFPHGFPKASRSRVHESRGQV